jgi:hypothetical protein
MDLRLNQFPKHRYHHVHAVLVSLGLHNRVDQLQERRGDLPPEFGVAFSGALSCHQNDSEWAEQKLDWLLGQIGKTIALGRAVK